MPNLPADLPEDWTSNQKISPNGTEVGLSEQHGYNYLMKQVNDTQEEVNNIGTTIEAALEDVALESSVQEVITTIGDTGDTGGSTVAGTVMAKLNNLIDQDDVQSNKLAQALASSGFRDTTRLALSNPEMAVDMVNLNKENIQKSIEEVSLSLDELLSGDYKTQIKKIREFRENLYP